MDIYEHQIIFQLLDDITMKLDRMSKETLSSDDDNNLTITEAKTIYAIGDKEPKTMKQISEILNIAPNTATVAVEKIVLKKLAVREASINDRRQLYIKLTPEGLSVLKRIVEVSIEQVKLFLSPLSDTEIVLLKNMLEKINRNI